jgi:DNA-binding NtrC family response regulator
MFSAYRWPGNVRELLSAVQPLLREQARPVPAQPVQARPARVAVTDPPSGGAPQATLEPLRLARRAARDQFEQDYLQALLARTQGNVTRAAAIAEVSRQMMQKLLRKYRAE